MQSFFSVSLLASHKMTINKRYTQMSFQVSTVITEYLKTPSNTTFNKIKKKKQYQVKPYIKVKAEGIIDSP
jgi:hypothetical protein